MAAAEAEEKNPERNAYLGETHLHTSWSFEVGNLTRTGYQGIFTAYAIQKDKIVTSLAEMPFEVAVYKMGGKHIAAHSNEFGYANHEIMPKPPINMLNLNKGSRQLRPQRTQVEIDRLEQSVARVLQRS